MNKLAPFRTRLVFLILLVVMPAVGLVLYGNLEQRRSEKTAVREAARALSQLAAARHENYVENARQLLATLSEVSFLVLSTNPAPCQVHFSNLRKLLPDYLNFGLIETNGILFCSAEPSDAGANLGNRAYFRRVLQTRKFSTGDFQLSRVTGRPALHFGYPVVDEKGVLRRVLYASLKLSLLSEAVAKIPLAPGGTVMVIDRNGTVLARYPEPEKWVGKSLSELPVTRRILAQKENAFEMSGLDGIARLHAVTVIQEGSSPSAFVSVGIPVSVSFAHANELLLRHLVILALVAVLVWLVARVYAQRFFLWPVNALAAAAQRLAEGDLSARAGPVHAASELVQLGRSFDEMAGRLQKRQAEIEQANAEIQSLNQDLERRVVERTAQLEAANKELEAFTYSVSHDLRAPLRHISAYAAALKEEQAAELGQTSMQYLSAIEKAASDMGALVDALLRFSRTARVQLRLSRVNLEQLVEMVRADLKSELNNRKVEWKIQTLPEARADPSLLRLVLLNLLSNALKYSRPRDPARIEIGSQSSDKEHIIYVRDNGVGFDMKYADKLFGVFERLHDKRDFEGTGVGLANVQRIIHRHGGRVWAEGKENEGATFYFTLPR